MAFGTRARDEKPTGFPAKYDGGCVACGAEIIAGEDLILWSTEYDAYVHEDCA